MTGYPKVSPEKQYEGVLLRVRDADWKNIWGENLSYKDAHKLKEQIAGSGKSRTVMYEPMSVDPPEHIQAEHGVKINSAWFREHLHELCAEPDFAGRWACVWHQMIQFVGDDQDQVYKEAIDRFGLNGGFAICHVVPEANDPIFIGGAGLRVEPLAPLPPLPVEVDRLWDDEQPGDWRVAITEEVAEVILKAGPTKPDMPEGAVSAVIESIDDRYELWVNDGQRATPTRISADDVISVTKLDPEIVKTRRAAAAAVRASSPRQRYFDKTATPPAPPRTTPPPPDKTVQTDPVFTRSKAPAAVPPRPPASPLKVAMQPLEVDLPENAITDNDLSDLIPDIGGGESPADLAHAQKLRDEQAKQGGQ